MEVHLDTLRDLDRPVLAPGSRRGVGVSALVLESGQTIELREEATGGFPGASWLPGGGEVATVRDLGGTVSGEAEGIVGAEEAIEGIVESAGEAIDIIAESAAGAIEGIVAAGTGEVDQGIATEYGEDEPGPQEGGRPSGRPARGPDRRSGR